MSNLFIGLGAINAFIAVSFGAFAAHKLKHSLTVDHLAIIHTAADYQLYHAIGLIVIGLLYHRSPTKCNMRAGWLMLGGTILFSGSLYILGLTGIKWLGMVTPVGGVCLLMAWVIVCLGHLWPQHNSV